MVPSHTRSHDRKLIYRYYVCSSTIKRGKSACDFRSISAGELEAAVLTQVKHLLRAPQITAKVLDLYYAQNPDSAEMMSEKELIESIHRFEQIWDQLYPAEQNNLLKLLISEIVVTMDGIYLKIHKSSIGDFAQTIVPPQPPERKIA